MKARTAAEQVIAKLQAGGYVVERIPNESNIVMLKPPAAKANGLTDRLAKADIVARITPAGMPFFINETILHQPVDTVAAAFL
jgi:threonine aldolase